MTDERESASRRRPQSTVSTLLAGNFGKLPPQAVDLEEAVLGALMLEKNALEQVINIIHADCFYKDTHKIIFQAIKKLYDKSQPTDILAVTNQLKTSAELDIVGGPFFITQLTNRVASSANMEFHARIIVQKYLQRELIRISSETIKNAYEDTTDVFEEMDKMDGALQELRTSFTVNESGKEWDEHVKASVEELKRLFKAVVKVSGIPTGSVKIDRITGGWQKSDLVIIAARPSMGKTTRMLNFAKSASITGADVAMFSLEMSAQQITRKFINEQSEVYGRKLITGDISNLELDRIVEAGDKLIKLPFYLNDKGGVNVNYIRSICRQRKKKFGLDMIIIDYLQLMKPVERKRGQTRDSEIGDMTTSLKALAKELNVTIIAGSQLNRQCELRPNKRPTIADLRESGSIENDADIVIALYRPSKYYAMVGDDPDYNERKQEEKGEQPYSLEEYLRLSELDIIKHRNGDTKFVRERFEGHISRFTTIEDPVKESAPIQYRADLHIEPTQSPEPAEEQTDDLPF